MGYLDRWSRETNPETGAAFEHFRLYMDCTQNGALDADALLATPFGERLTELLERRFRFERLDPMCPEILKYYESIGVKKQMFDREEFFSRWALFSPAETDETRKYPLLIWNHGGKETIEDEEYITDLVPLAAAEQILILMAQDTSWEHNAELIERVAALMPLDRERVYMGGFSQGGRLAGAAQLRMPEKLAAVALSGGPVFDTTDNHAVPYTLLEAENLAAWCVPFLQIENRYIVVDNTNHWPPVNLGSLIWDFFRRFRRDSETGNIVEDEYKGYEGKNKGGKNMEPIICPEKYRVVTKDSIIVRKKADDWLYIFDEVNSVMMYLIVGEERALLFDTGYGFVPFRHLIDEVTDKPLTVVCSHGHDDHILGCFQFGEAWIGDGDLELCLSNDNPEQKEKQIISRRNKTPDIDALVDRDAYFATTLENCKFHIAHDGDVFDLGGLTLRVYAIPGHTKGSIGLYCPEKKAVFTGDTVMKNHVVVYGQALEVSGTPQEFIHALTRLEALDIETVWPAHGNAPAEKEYLTKTREMLIDWAHNGDIEKDSRNFERKPNSPFGNPNVKKGKYTYKDVFMTYHPGHLDQIHAFMAAHGGAVE